MKKITFLTRYDDVPDVVQGNVGVLIQSPADSPLFPPSFNLIPFHHFIQDSEKTRQLACETAINLLQDEPQYRGVPQLTIFQESVTAELHRAFQLIQLHDYLIRDGFTQCEFISHSWWGNELKKLVALLNSPLKVELPVVSRTTRWQRIVNRILSNRLSWKAIYTEWNRALNAIDPFRRRSLWLNRFKNQKNNINKNKPWFYTTAVTYTQMGLLYESLWQEPFSFLVESSLTGSRPLITIGRFFHSLYDFASSKFIPHHEEIHQAKIAIQHHILNKKLNREETIVRDMLIHSTMLETFFSRLLSCGLFFSSLFESWLDQVKPSVVIVGNPVFEGYALHKARSKNIPTVLLQHGVLGPYYPFSDYPVDSFVVRGQYWYDQLSPESKKRAVILNPSYNKKREEKKSADSIVFITTPLRLNESTCDIDLQSILHTVVQAASELNINLIIRVHPLETIQDYKNRIESLLEKNTFSISIQYSQGEVMDKILSKAFAVVTFSSTVFLDCLHYPIPIISFDWIRCYFKDRIKSKEVFFYAENLAELKKLLEKAVQGQLQPPQVDRNFFLAEELGKCF